MIRSRLAVLLLPAVTLLGCHEDLGVVAGRPAERVEVAEVEIHGVTAVDEPALRSVLETRESPWLPWSEPEYFSRDVFQADLERVTAFYADRGYPHARVVESDVAVRDGGEAVALRIVVEEGSPVVVDGLDLELGARSLAPQVTIGEELFAGLYVN